MRVCGAKTRNGGTCKQAALENGRCHYHGGKTPAGIASPSFRTGRYSKVLPARLTARYQEAQADTELLALRDEVGLLDARLSDLLARVDTGESGALWQSLQAARLEFLDAHRRGHTLDQTAALNLMVELIGKGHADYRAWHEVGAALEQRRKLVESERKRLVEAQQMITAEQALVLMEVLLKSVRQHVQDRSILTAIQKTFDTLAARPDQRIIDVE